MSNSCRYQSIQIWSRRKKPFLNKNPKINPFVVKSLLESNCKRFRQTAIRENFDLKPKTQLKKTFSTNGGNYTHQYDWSKREAATSFLHLCLNTIWTPGHWHICVSKCPTFFPVFAGQNQISGTLGATNEHVH